jgi:hypothetical protein
MDRCRDQLEKTLASLEGMIERWGPVLGNDSFQVRELHGQCWLIRNALKGNQRSEDRGAFSVWG